MKKYMIALMSLLVSNMALAAALTHFSLDNRTVTRGDADRKDLRYDASWFANGSQARITDNGESVASGRSGTVHWAPTSCGEHHLQLAVVDGSGAQVGSASSDFDFYEASLEHDWKTTISAISATCTTAGRTAEVKCSRCGATLETSHAVPALGHAGQLVMKGTPNGTAPTAVDLKCTRCGVVFWSGLLSVDGAWAYQ